MSNKEKKVLKDNINGITKPALKRLTYQAGVIRTSRLVYEDLRARILDFLHLIVKDALVFTGYNKRKTVQESDVRHAFEVRRMYIAASYGLASEKGESVVTLASRTKKADDSEAASAVDAPKKRKSRPLVHAKRNIEFYQKKSENFCIPILSFGRIVREVAQSYSNDVSFQFQRRALLLIQLACERFIVTLCKNAYDFPLAGKKPRRTLQVEDIHLAVRHMKSGFGMCVV